MEGTCRTQQTLLPLSSSEDAATPHLKKLKRSVVRVGHPCYVDPSMSGPELLKTRSCKRHINGQPRRASPRSSGDAKIQKHTWISNYPWWLLRDGFGSKVLPAPERGHLLDVVFHIRKQLTCLLPSLDTHATKATAQLRSRSPKCQGKTGSCIQTPV